tara:strand:- start:572 stop:934 length:363 start_codon:yes stop_codon:yes gene_type:complete
MKIITASFVIKVLYFFPLFLFGLMHFCYPLYFCFLVPKFIPGGIFWVYFSGLALTSSSLAIIVNIIPKISIICLIIFVLIFVVTVDIPGILYGETTFRFAISLLKDVSLFSGTCLYLKIS